jgi:hypothetical protein
MSESFQFSHESLMEPNQGDGVYAIKSKDGIQKYELPDIFSEEQPEEYLSRVTMDIERICDPSHIRLKKGLNFQFHIEPVIAGVIKKIKNSGKTEGLKFSKEKRSSVRELVTRSFRGSNNKYEEVGSYPFDRVFSHTNTNRLFGDIAFGTDSIPYSQSMFGMAYDDELDVSDAFQDYLSERINGKDIMLLGGGDSVRDIIDFNNNFSGKGLTPSKIINIDPYILSEEVIKGEIVNMKDTRLYESFPVSATDKDGVIRSIQETGLEGVDEIWASYSVPFYLDNMSDVRKMFDVITLSLKPGGNARITPLSMMTEHPEVDSEEFANIVDEINEMPDFNAYVFYNGVDWTLVVHKLKINT